jgi:hypothetical protein
MVKFSERNPVALKPTQIIRMMSRVLVYPLTPQDAFLFCLEIQVSFILLVN